MVEFLVSFQAHIIAGIVLLITVIATGHVVMNKNDTRAAIGWTGIILLFPIFGTILYILFGINRIKRKASSLRGKAIREYLLTHTRQCSKEELKKALPDNARHLFMLYSAVNAIAKRPLVCGNEIIPLLNGDEAYPAMIDAINNARTSITLATYIFQNDYAGKLFTDALGKALKRGVEIRVLIDHVGSRYSFPSIIGSLKRARIKTARFIPTYFPLPTQYMNLRNHRKILIVDGTIGFTGGMNIGQVNIIKKNYRHQVQDLHFQIKGPVVSHLQEAFAEDWVFAAQEVLEGEKWFPALYDEGAVIARGITDGPDEDKDKHLTVILSALTCARNNVRIITPYFLPESELMSALTIAALRGVAIDIMLPRINNLRLVHWASLAHMGYLLEHGCRIWFNPPPFDHTKMMVVDDAWSFIGSSNWDPRSLQLNFEFNIECYSTRLADDLIKIYERKKMHSEQLILDKLKKWPFLIHLRNNIARLLTPYL